MIRGERSCRDVIIMVVYHFLWTIKGTLTDKNKTNTNVKFQLELHKKVHQKSGHIIYGITMVQNIILLTVVHNTAYVNRVA